jgi:hypothetical protein
MLHFSQIQRDQKDLATSPERDDSSKSLELMSLLLQIEPMFVSKLNPVMLVIKFLDNVRILSYN